MFSWNTLPSPPATVQPSRYGHASVALADSRSGAKMYVFSGFDSTMIANALVYDFPTCSGSDASEPECAGE